MDQAEKLRDLAKSRARAPGPVTIAVASGKGGTGKTSFCVNFAIALAQQGKSVMIVDGDFGLSNVHVMLGTKPRAHLGTVLSGKGSFADAICRGHGGIWYVAGGSGVEELLNISPEMLQVLHREMDSLELDLDYIIFDCSAGVNRQVLDLMMAADELVVVMTPEPTSVADAFVLLKSSISQGFKQPVRFVMNRAETSVEAMMMARHFKSIVLKYLSCQVNYLGHVAMDKNVVHSIKQQMPLLLAYPASPAAADIRQIAKQYEHYEAVQQAGGLQRIFSRILGR